MSTTATEYAARVNQLQRIMDSFDFGQYTCIKSREAGASGAIVLFLKSLDNTHQLVVKLNTPMSNDEEGDIGFSAQLSEAAVYAYVTGTCMLTHPATRPMCPHIVSGIPLKKTIDIHAALSSMAFTSVGTRTKVMKFLNAAKDHALPMTAVVSELGGEELAPYTDSLGPRMVTLPKDEYAQIAIQIMFTLTVFQRIGVVHNDLHGGNVMLHRGTGPGYIYPVWDPVFRAYLHNPSGYRMLRVPTRLTVKIFDFDRASMLQNTVGNRVIEPAQWACADYNQCGLVKNPHIDSIKALLAHVVEWNVINDIEPVAKALNAISGLRIHKSAMKNNTDAANYNYYAMGIRISDHALIDQLNPSRVLYHCEQVRERKSGILGR